jgi:hypothetical protein
MRRKGPARRGIFTRIRISYTANLGQELSTRPARL